MTSAQWEDPAPVSWTGQLQRPLNTRVLPPPSIHCSHCFRILKAQFLWICNYSQTKTALTASNTLKPRIKLHSNVLSSSITRLRYHVLSYHFLYKPKGSVKLDYLLFPKYSYQHSSTFSPLWCLFPLLGIYILPQPLLKLSHVNPSHTLSRVQYQKKKNLLGTTASPNLHTGIIFSFNAPIYNLFIPFMAFILNFKICPLDHLL